MLRTIAVHELVSIRTTRKNDQADETGLEATR